MIVPQREDLLIYQGVTYEQAWEFTYAETGAVMDFTGKSARVHFRPQLNSPDTEIFQDFTTVSSPYGLITLTTGVTQSTVNFYIPDKITATFPYKIKSNEPVKVGVYDLKVYNASVSDRLMYGDIIVSPEVTRWVQ